MSFLDVKNIINSAKSSTKDMRGRSIRSSDIGIMTIRLNSPLKNSDDCLLPNTDTFVRTNNDKMASGSYSDVSASEYFSLHTVELNNKFINHHTRLLEVAASDLGLYEITPDEYNYLDKNNHDELLNTQYKIIKGFGKIGHQWCAHTVSYYSLLAGVDIGPHKARVQDFIDWAGSDYKRINMIKMTPANYQQERASRIGQVTAQLERMQEGDFIIWKTDDTHNKNGSYAVKLPNGSIKICERSHIGIIEHVDKQRGIVTVIEGNANEPVTMDNADRILVKKSSEGVYGDQAVGEFQEVNRRDGLIRKEYTISELACFGYTGYIDNHSRVPRVY